MQLRGVSKLVPAIATSDGALMLLSASETAKPAVLIGVDELGTGLVSVGNSKGEYRTLEPGP